MSDTGMVDVWINVLACERKNGAGLVPCLDSTAIRSGTR